MKKALAIFMVFAMVTGVAFAQDAPAAPAAPAPALKLSGAIKTGFNATFGDSAEDGAIVPYNDDAEKVSRFELKGAYTDGDIGLNFRIRADDFATPKLSYGYVWANLFTNIVTFKAGIVDDKVWETEGEENYDVASGMGVQIQIKPVEGVNLGVMLTTAKDSTPMTTEQFAGELGFGGSYVSDLFNVQAGYKLDSDFDEAVDKDGYLVKVYGDKVTAADFALTYPDVNPEDFAFAYVGINVKAIENLTLIGEAEFMNLGAYSDIGLAEINELVEYAVTDPLAVGVLAYQWIPGNSDLETIMNFEPYVKYKLNDKATAGFAFLYELNSGYKEDATTMYFKPRLTYAFNSHAKIDAFYKYVVADDTVDTTADSVVQLDFIWSF